MGKDDKIKLTPGSRYRITSMMTRDEPLTTEGTFKGYTMVGNVDALVMDVAPQARGKGEGKVKGKVKAKPKEELRLIPAQMIIAVDVLTQAEEKEEKEETPSSRYYY